jgi:acyl-CoA thioester hydrolase
MRNGSTLRRNRRRIMLRRRVIGDCCPLNDQPAKPVRKPPPQFADFPSRAVDTIRYGDLDPQGHVNNAVFATYFETGRVHMFRTPDLGVGVDGASLILARTEIDFLRELRWPGTVEIGTGIEAFGRSSFTVAQAIFRDGTCAATGRATLVFFDTATRRSRPLAEILVQRLSKYLLAGS